MAESLIARLIAKDPIVLNIQNELQKEGKRLDETAAGRLLVPDVDASIHSSKQHINYLDTHIKESRKDKKEKEKLEKEKQRTQERQRQQEQQRERLRARVAPETEEKIRKERRSISLKDGISIFAAITGVALNVIFNLLPLFGINV